MKNQNKISLLWIVEKAIGFLMALGEFLNQKPDVRVTNGNQKQELVEEPVPNLKRKLADVNFDDFILLFFRFRKREVQNTIFVFSLNIGILNSSG